MSKRLFSRRALALLLVSLVWLPATAEAKKLRWKLEKGQSFKVTVSQEMKQTISAAGNDQELPMNLQAEMTWTVEDIDKDGNFKLAQTIDRVAMKIEAPQPLGTIEYDSAKLEEPNAQAAMIAGAFKPLIGKKIQQVMSPRGKILESKFPEGLAGGANNPMAQMLSGDQLKDLINTASPEFPEGELTKGQKWTRKAENEIPQMGKMIVTTEYTYAGEETVDGRTLDKIDLTTKVEVEGGGFVKIEVGEQKGQGAMYFDAKLGRFVNSKLQQTMQLDIAIAGQQMSQKMQTTVNTKMTPASSGE